MVRSQADLQRLFLGAGLYASCAAFLRLVGFIVFVYLARVLRVEDYARWGLLYALQTAITTFGIAGIVEAVVALLKDTKAEEERGALFSLATSVFLLVSAVTAVVAVLILKFYFGSKELAAGTVASVVMSGVLLAYASLQGQIIRLDERHIHSLYFSFLVPLFGYLGGGAAFLEARTIGSYFEGCCLGLAAPVLVAPVLQVGKYAVILAVREWKPVLLRIGPFIVVAFLGWFGGYGSNYIIKLFFEPKDVAGFTFLMSLATIMQLVATSMAQVWNPRFYRIVHELPLTEAERQNRFFFQLQGLALGLTGAALIMLYPLALRLLGGNLQNYASMQPQFLLLICAYIILVPFWHCQNYLLTFDKGSSLMNVHLLTGALMIGALLFLMWVAGPIGVYIGFAVQMLLRTIGVLIVARKNWPVTIAWKGVAGGLLLAFTSMLISRSAFH